MYSTQPFKSLGSIQFLYKGTNTFTQQQEYIKLIINGSKDFYIVIEIYVFQIKSVLLN